MDSSRRDSFPILLRRAPANRIKKPEDMDDLVEEVSRALLLCCVVESTLSKKERAVHRELLFTITEVDYKLHTHEIQRRKGWSTDDLLGRIGYLSHAWNMKLKGGLYSSQFILR
jgi:hypothetical protein